MKEIFSRRSVRSYLTTPVEREKLLDVMKAGAYAPSALNNQERQFTAIVNETLIKELNAAVSGSVDDVTKQRICARTGGEFNFFYGAPVLIVVSHEENAFCPAADCAVALENMFLEAESLGLGTCWINQLNALCDQTNVREVLTKAGVPLNHKVYGCCALGYSDAERKLLKEKQSKIVIFD